MAKSRGDRPLLAGAAGLAIIRLFLGTFFLNCGIDQLTHANGFVHYFKMLEVPHAVSGIPGVWPYYAGFVHAPLTLSTASCFGWTIIGCELLVGVLLLLGLLTRLAAFIPIVANLYFFYTAFPLLRHEELFHGLWINVGFLLMELAVLIAAAGRTWGLDALLAARTKVRLFW